MIRGKVNRDPVTEAWFWDVGNLHGAAPTWGQAYGACLRAVTEARRRQRTQILRRMRRTT